MANYVPNWARGNLHFVDDGVTSLLARLQPHHRSADRSSDLNLRGHESPCAVIPALHPRTRKVQLLALCDSLPDPGIFECHSEQQTSRIHVCLSWSGCPLYAL